MQRPVQLSYGQVKQNVEGCLFVWTGKKILMYHGGCSIKILHANRLSFLHVCIVGKACVHAKKRWRAMSAVDGNTDIAGQICLLHNQKVFFPCGITCTDK